MNLQTPGSVPNNNNKRYVFMKIVKVSPTNIYRKTFSDFVIISPYLTKREYVNFVLFYINLNFS